MVSPFRRRKYSALFRHLDNNGDGLIDLTDWDRYAEIMRKERGWSRDEPRLASLIETTDQWWMIIRDAMRVTDKGFTCKQLIGFLDGMAQEARAGAPPPQWAIDPDQPTLDSIMHRRHLIVHRADKNPAPTRRRGIPRTVYLSKPTVEAWIHTIEAVGDRIVVALP